MLDEYITVMAAAIISAAVVILASFLIRYGKLVEDADKSTRLAKDVWDSVSVRFSVVDTRIIDLMAKTDVLASRLQPPTSLQPLSSVTTATKVAQGPDRPVTEAATTNTSIYGEGTETEKKVLGLLAQGPKDSAQIREAVGRSREHTARLMKSLFDRGLVVRNARNKPYVYEITEGGRSYLTS